MNVSILSLLFIVSTTLAISLRLKVPFDRPQIFPNVYSIRAGYWNGIPNVQTIAFVHMLDHNTSTGSFNSFAVTDCCAVLADGARWKTTEGYTIDVGNEQGLSSSFITTALSSATTAWDSQLAFSLIGTQTVGSITTIDTSGPDGQNQIIFAVLNSESVIAVTYIHGTFGGSVSGRSIIEFDMIFNENFAFGDGASNKMDLQAIATHEFGHAFGLGHPDAVSACSETTMFPTASFGETKKRSLHADDIACICNLYNDPNCGGGDSPGENAGNSGASASMLSALWIGTLMFFLVY